MKLCAFTIPMLPPEEEIFLSRFTALWAERLARMPHPRAAEILSNPGGAEWQALAAEVAADLEGLQLQAA